MIVTSPDRAVTFSDVYMFILHTNCRSLYIDRYTLKSKDYTVVVRFKSSHALQSVILLSGVTMTLGLNNFGKQICGLTNLKKM